MIIPIKNSIMKYTPVPISISIENNPKIFIPKRLVVIMKKLKRRLLVSLHKKNEN